jgi:hypothetical protein
MIKSNQFHFYHMIQTQKVNYNQINNVFYKI